MRSRLLRAVAGNNSPWEHDDGYLDTLKADINLVNNYSVSLAPEGNNDTAWARTIVFPTIVGATYAVAGQILKSFASRTDSKFNLSLYGPTGNVLSTIANGVGDEDAAGSEEFSETFVATLTQHRVLFSGKNGPTSVQLWRVENPAITRV